MICLITSMAMMQGCSFNKNSMEKFVKEEQYSITYSEYEDFIVSNLAKLPENQRNNFATRLKFKPLKSDNSVIMINTTIDEEKGVGKAVFSVKNTLEYRLVTFSFDKEGIIEYDVKTLYGVK